LLLYSIDTKKLAALGMHLCWCSWQQKVFIFGNEKSIATIAGYPMHVPTNSIDIYANKSVNYEDSIIETKGVQLQKLAYCLAQLHY
jgi:hypothetical protein